VPAERLAERQPGDEDEPVRGRDERRQVVEPVRVDAPDDRPGHLGDGRCTDDDGDLGAPLDRKRPGGEQEHDPGEPTQDELAVEVDVAVDPEESRQIRGDRCPSG
jgi:hypothetical protein